MASVVEPTSVERRAYALIAYGVDIVMEALKDIARVEMINPTPWIAANSIGKGAVRKLVL
ncbi:MAG: hypothetical protein NZ960_07760 [Candidatus Kapabacteria bacterium]|nr:hypothetical protein [Candidatus Kapabacteria bacterium]